MENPQQIIRSWGLQGGFANGAVSQDKLVPSEFTRIRTPFLQTWRQEQLSSTFDWGANAFSWYSPESLRVISSMFLRIELPALSSGSYKDIPGMYVLERVRFLTGGSESYFVQPQLFLRDYIESLTDEEAKRFITTFLGYRGDGGSNEARTLLIPIMLPNSAYLFRNGKDSHGHGIFPAYLGTNRLEVQFTVNAPGHVVKNGAENPGTIINKCSVMIHQVEMSSKDIEKYSDSRGSYSVMTRRFTELTDGWTAATADTRVKINQSQPIGVVTELFALAVPSGTNNADKEIQTMVLAKHIGITSDSVVQKQLDTPEKVEVELWQNGFIGNAYANSPSRLCCAAHAADAENLYSGGYNMQHSSQVTVDIEYPQNVDFRLYAVQLQRVIIDPDGNIVSSLD